MTATKLLEIFNVEEPISDNMIEENSSPLFDLELDVFLIVPSYMAWCLKHDHNDGNIIIDGTISMLSELGRCKFTEIGNSRFKYQCSKEQVYVVISFLNWCLSFEFLEREHTLRAIKQWSKPINLK